MSANTLRLRGRRLARRRDRTTLKQTALLHDPERNLAWVAIKNRFAEAKTVEARVNLEWLTADEYDTRGRLLCARIEVEREQEHHWIPRFDELPRGEANVLHISICFEADLERARRNGHQYVLEAYDRAAADISWQNSTYQTFVETQNRDTGTFFLAGFQNDRNLKTLHDYGSYWERQFGHVAIYVGGF